MKLRTQMVLAAVVCFAASTPVLAQGQAGTQSSDSSSSSGSSISEHEKTILDNLSQGSLGEVQLGKLAEKKGSVSAVKDFGKRMADDHSVLEKQTAQLAAKLGVSVPNQPTSEARSAWKDLSSKSGKSFDKSYVEMMLKDHQKDIQDLRQFAESATNPQMKDFVWKTIPILENHLRIAEHIAGQIGVSPEMGLSQPVHPGSTSAAGTVGSSGGSD